MQANTVPTSLKHFMKTGLARALFLAMTLSIMALPVNAATCTGKETKMENGVVQLNVPGNADFAWNRLISILETMKAPVFSKIDHKANAVSVGLDMKNARVVSFGNPAVGTFLMQENPEAALDLPLKILVWDSPDGTVLSWNDPAWIARRYGINPENDTVKKMQKMFETLAGKMCQTH